ncbi:MAG: DUF2490 domain-containing protein [Pontiella sp.]
MKKRILTLLAATLIPFAGVGKEGDWGSVSDFIVSYNMTPKWFLFSRSQVQLNADISTLYLGLIDAGLGYRINANWNVGAAYRRFWVRPRDEWLADNRPLIDLTWSDTFKQTKVSNRSRVEFHFYEYDKDDDIRFRNATRVVFPWDIVGIKPYVDEEFFISHNAGTLNMNWLGAGLTYKVADSMSLRLGYRWVTLRLKDHSWGNRNALTTALVLTF